MILLQINTTACDGSSVFWPWFLWLLGAFILGAILGWLLRCIFGNCGSNDNWEDKYNSTKADLEVCLKDKNSLKADLDNCLKSKKEIIKNETGAASIAPSISTEKKSENEYKSQLLGEVGVVVASEKDDLKKIKGIGKVYESKLNNIGIYTFAQISKLKDEGIKAVEALTGFPGRVKRENWIGQAKTLSEGGATEFSKRVDKGKVDYSKNDDERYS